MHTLNWASLKKQDEDIVNQYNIAAFFDFDKTLLEVESARIGLKWLKDNHMLALGFVIKLFVVNVLYQGNLISDERMCRIMLTIYKNRKLTDFQKTADDFYRAYLKPRLAPKIISRVDFHKKEGHLLVLVSGSVRYWLEPVVRDIGFHHLLCTDLEVSDEGLLTGKPKGLVCVDKSKKWLVLNLVERHSIDLKNSYAYGNHQADLPLLELVGYPCVVEPTMALKKVAYQRSWPILSYK